MKCQTIPLQSEGPAGLCTLNAERQQLQNLLPPQIDAAMPFRATETRSAKECGGEAARLKRPFVFPFLWAQETFQ